MYCNANKGPLLSLEQTSYFVNIKVGFKDQYSRRHRWLLQSVQSFSDTCWEYFGAFLPLTKVESHCTFGKIITNSPASNRSGIVEPWPIQSRDILSFQNITKTNKTNLLWHLYSNKVSLQRATDKLFLPHSLEYHKNNIYIIFVLCEKYANISPSKCKCNRWQISVHHLLARSRWCLVFEVCQEGFHPNAYLCCV